MKEERDGGTSKEQAHSLCLIRGLCDVGLGVGGTATFGDNPNVQGNRPL